MRGEALDAAGYGELPEEHGKTTIHVRVDGRGLDASADPPVIDDMVAEWQNEVADVAPDEQKEAHEGFNRGLRGCEPTYGGTGDFDFGSFSVACCRKC